MPAGLAPYAGGNSNFIVGINATTAGDAAEFGFYNTGTVTSNFASEGINGLSYGVCAFGSGHAGVFMISGTNAPLDDGTSGFHVTTGPIRADNLTPSTMVKVNTGTQLVSATVGTDYSPALTVQTGTLATGTVTFTVPSGCHPWAQDTTSANPTKVSVSGTTATVVGTGSDVVNLFNLGNQ
jgi:hypothetical protein